MQIQHTEARSLGEDMQIEQAEARHTERKCNFSRRKQATRRGNADLAGGSRPHGEDMQI